MYRTRVLPFLAALLAAGLSCAGFALIGSPADASAHRAATLPAKPKVGECRNLTAQQMNAYSNSTAPTDCAGTHTAYTFAVPVAPTKVKFKKLSAKALSELATTLCTPRYTKFLGRTEIQRKQTQLFYVFFVPTKAQRAAGARWVRCDMVLAVGRDVGALPTLTSPLPSPLPDSIRKCVTSDQLFTTCDHPHAHRSVAAFRVPAKKHPTRAQFIKYGERYCPANGNDYFSWPTALGWKNGARVEVCYRDTTS